MASNQNFKNFIFSDNGNIIPDTSELKTDVQNEMLEAFGADLSLEDSTPQGRLIDIETNARQDVINFTSEVANSLVNINKAGGVILDYWMSNFNLQRGTSKSSTVGVTVTGLPETIIPVGAQAQDENGNIWLNESEIIIGSNGIGNGIFYSQEQGAINLQANELNKIVIGTPIGVTGWQSITNPAPAQLGSTVQDDWGAFKLLSNAIYRGTALFGNYKSILLKNVENVIDCFTQENPYDATLTYDNYDILPHSVFVSVLGGNAQDIGQQLLYIKSAGCNWNGNTTVIAKDTTYNTSTPVTFYTPSGVQIAVQVNATNLNAGQTDLVDTIQNTILNYFNNEYAPNGYPAPYIRGLINPYTLTQVIVSNVAGINIDDLEIGIYNPLSGATVSIIQGANLSNAQVNFDTFKSQITESGNYNFIYGVDTGLSSAVPTQTEGSGLESLEVTTQLFFNNFNASDTYTFTMLGTTEGLWRCSQDGNDYTLAQLGITYEGTATQSSVIQVVAEVTDTWLYHNSPVVLATYGLSVDGTPQISDNLLVNLIISEPVLHATTELIKASITSGIYWSSVNAKTFSSKISENGVYTFVYNNSNEWTLNYATVNLQDYGINVLGSPILNDKIIVSFNNGQFSNKSIQLYCTEYPIIASEYIYVTINNPKQIYS